MLVVGITGGIGAGKSVVSRILRSRGHEVYDCDLEARILMDQSEELKAAIAGRFGKECIGDDGTLDRKAIAGYVFGDDSHRLWLNASVHAMVREDVARRVALASGNVFFVESAILRSSGLSAMCGSIWVVDAPEHIRLARACSRDNADVESVKARMEAQKDELTGYGDTEVAVLINDGVTPLLPQIDNFLNKILKENA